MGAADERGVKAVWERWAMSAMMVPIAAVILATGGVNANTMVSVAILAVVAWVFSPWFFPRSHRDAAGRQRADAAGVPLIYWRPGCMYCMRLRFALGLAGRRAVWVDIWRDADAAARVRGVNDGNETVPTVFVGESHRVNPSPGWVRRRLRAGSGADT